MIYAIDNGETHDDHSIDFVESDLAPGELATLIEIEHGPTEQQNHRWSEIPPPKTEQDRWENYGRRLITNAPVREIPFVIFVADVSTWAPNLERGGFHHGISARVLTKTPRGEIYWLAHESTALLERWAKTEEVGARADLDQRAGKHPAWVPFQPIRWELEWRATGKTCGCGIHHTARAWLELEQARFQWCPEDAEDGPELLECRHCSCGSTIARLHRLPFKWRPPIANTYAQLNEAEQRDTRHRLESLAMMPPRAYAVATAIEPTTNRDATNLYVVHLSARPFHEGQDLADVEPVGDVVLAEVVRRVRAALWTNTLAGLRILNGPGEVVIRWPVDSPVYRDGGGLRVATTGEVRRLAAGAIEVYRARIDRLRGSAAFSIDGISAAMRARGVVAVLAGDSNQAAGVASFRLVAANTGEPLTPDAWRDVVAWFAAEAPVTIRVHLSDGFYVWDSASREGPVAIAIPLPPPRSPV